MWTYEQGSGKLYRPDGSLAAIGYSGGNDGLNPEGVNNHAMQCIRNVGPIPVGWYAFGNVIDVSHLGPFAIPILPEPSNQMCGRSGFFCHGDKSSPTKSASQGCIIMPRNIRDEMNNSEDKRLAVVYIK